MLLASPRAKPLDSHIPCYFFPHFYHVRLDRARTRSGAIVTQTWSMNKTKSRIEQPDVRANSLHHVASNTSEIGDKGMAECVNDYYDDIDTD